MHTRLMDDDRASYTHRHTHSPIHTLSLSARTDSLTRMHRVVAALAVLCWAGLGCLPARMRIMHMLMPHAQLIRRATHSSYRHTQPSQTLRSSAGSITKTASGSRPTPRSSRASCGQTTTQSGSTLASSTVSSTALHRHAAPLLGGSPWKKRSSPSYSTAVRDFFISDYLSPCSSTFAVSYCCPALAGCVARSRGRVAF